MLAGVANTVGLQKDISPYHIFNNDAFSFLLRMQWKASVLFFYRVYFLIMYKGVKARENIL